MTPRAPFSYLLAVAWTGLVATGLRLLLGAGMAWRPSIAYDLVTLGALEALVFMLGVFGVLALHASGAPLSAALGLRPTHPGLTLLGVALGFAAHFPAESVDVLFQRLVPTPEEELAGRLALLTADTPGRIVVVLLVVACVGPLVEELFFRGALYGALRRDHPLLGTTLVTAFCFVVGHLDFYLWPALTVVALLMTYLRAVSGSLLPALAMHVTFNAVTELSVIVAPPDVSAPPHVELAPTVLGWTGTLTLVFGVKYLASRAAQARRGRAEDAE